MMLRNQLTTTLLILSSFLLINQSVLCTENTSRHSLAPLDGYLKEARQQDVASWITGIRRELHQYPELMYEEVQTSALIRKTLDSLGIKYKYPLGKTGVAATLGTANGPHVALRADMDALPIAEAVESEFKSKNEGKMHACGHDGHTSMLLGAARMLKAREKELKGKVTLVFQPAEEGGAGARLMMDEGLFADDKPDFVFGLHVDPSLETGRVSLTPGTVLASSGAFIAKISASGSHAAFPHLTADTIVTASAVVGSLQTLIARKLDPLEAGVVSVTMIHGGTALNVLPPEVEIGGTFRSLTMEGHHKLQQWIEHTITQQAAVHGCNSSVDFLEDRHPSYPPTVNDAAATAYARSILEQVVGAENALPGTPWMGAEDFGFFTQRFPSCFFMLGVKKPGTDSAAKLHTGTFGLDEDALPIGAALHTALAEQYLKSETERRTSDKREEL
ncbi:peptidase M20/M25/M40 family protein [Klebsormidium nitens]|uniref:Peptidase M20/M25/M40 family protein n=1 Tax=Klebsormidium nitens TaxID=105231 RepID=A0A1Y1HLP4_KLENI|nr:peptidase M20/M25/M40 family protein [Klebsormidium nitens]|eukprot:GAQ79540.1 peptidase M20/M25/M40 family protein [Klebsormidium nitens]